MEVPRWEAGSVVFENKLYVFGGYKMPTKACKRVDVFNPKNNSWTKYETPIVYHASPSLYLYTLEDGSAVKVSTNANADYRYPHYEATAK